MRIAGQPGPAELIGCRPCSTSRSPLAARARPPSSPFQPPGIEPTAGVTDALDWGWVDGIEAKVPGVAAVMAALRQDQSALLAHA